MGVLFGVSISERACRILAIALSGVLFLYVCASIPALAQSLVWLPPEPAARAKSAMAYDSSRGVVVLFGGRTSSQAYGETWEWNGRSWTLRSVNGPSSRAGHAMTYDANRHVTVLFGGIGEGSPNGGLNGETWEWDGNTWTQRVVDGPTARASHAMAYDEERQVSILFGGQNGTGVPYGDTWEWDGCSWRQKSVNGPTARYGHAVAYDAIRRILVLFGGRSNFVANDETWEWDGTVWMRRLVTGPAPRFDHAMSFDAVRGTTVLFGGYVSPGGPNGETWEWNGNGWIQRVASGPAPQSGCVMAYDLARGNTVLFGTETWQWSGAAWSQRANNSPSARYGHSLAYEAGRGAMLLFGGWTATNPPFNDETWEWDGAWTRRMVGGPSPRMWHGTAYDNARGVVILFGGQSSTPNGETWEWDGNIWNQRTVAGPSARSRHAMVYDAARGVTLLFGGFTNAPNGETWVWDGATWILQNVAGPPPRQLHAMAYDSVRDVTVLFGGTAGAPLGDTWEWNGAVWEQKMVNGPSARWGHAMAFDARRGVVVLYAGGTDTQINRETWEWNGAAWSFQAVSNPGYRQLHAMGYDAAGDRAVLFGGYAGIALGDTWGLWCFAPFVTRQPDSQSTCSESSVSFAVTAAGPGALSYQWRHGAPPVAIPGATSATYMIAAPTPADAGPYDCIVSNACGSVTSNTATLTVNAPSWVQVATTGPSPRNAFAMTYDRARQQVVLFGGDTNSGTSGETWVWDGVAWTRVALTGPQPFPRINARMAYDAARGECVMFGAEGGPGDVTTWLWNGVQWRDAGQDPGNNQGPGSVAMAYDPVRQRVVMHGGRSWIDTTREWDGSAWTLAATGAPPSGRSGHRAEFLPSRGKVIIFGGWTTPGVAVNELWEWSGAAWSAVPQLSPPPGRYAHAMAYDAARERLVVVGGTNELGPCGFTDTWEFDGIAWQQMDSGAGFPGVSSSSAVYDEARQQVVLFGGLINNCSVRSGSTWVWTAKPALTSRPQSVSLCRTVGSAAFSVTAGGNGPFAYQWQIESSPLGSNIWSDLSDGPVVHSGVLVGTGAGSATNQYFFEHTGTNLQSLRFRCTVTNSCGSVPSGEALLSICTANCDCSTGSPILNVNDFSCFLNNYAAGDPYANCDGSTVPPLLNVNDFLCFINSYAAGCP